MKIKAVVFTEPGVAQLQTFEMPSCAEDEVTTETIYSFVSPGTELRIFSGALESKEKFPVIPGYSWVGRVTKVGANVKGWEEGDLVSGRTPIRLEGFRSLWGGQTSHHNCKVTGYDALLKLPAQADPWCYTPVEVAAIAWRGASIASPAPGECAVVIGQGLIGGLTAWWLHMLGLRVIVCDLEELRLARARKLGMYAAINARTDCREKILAHCPGGADIVVEASGSKPGVELAASLLRKPFSRQLDKGYEPTPNAGGEKFARLVYLATYVNTTCPLPAVEGAVVLQPADRTVADRLAVMNHIRNGMLKVDDFADKPVPIADAPTAYPRLRDNPDKYSSLVFDWA